MRSNGAIRGIIYNHGTKHEKERNLEMAKETKTNAMRILERNKVPYELIQYECDGFIDGLHTAQKTGAPVEQSFKTLVAQGKSGEYYVFVIPIAEEVNLKTAAKTVGEKSVEMLHVKDLTKITGYVRGGCSPLGMKKQFRTVIHESARSFDKIYVSGGRIGSTIKVSPLELAKVVRAEFGDITV
jgi:Cys-tRNA(Pro)/Cys-tRNA(Cys) deacylase